MAIGTAMAIALAASAASSAYAAHKQSSAAKDAAKTQSASADKAMALQKEMADRALQAQNQAMYGGGGGGGGGYGYGGGSQGGMGGGIQGMYAPYVNTGPATLSALHEYLGIPGASQSQTAVPFGAYGRPMSPQFGGGPMGQGSPAMSAGMYRPMTPPGQAPPPGQFQGVPLPPSSQMAPSGQPFRPRVGPGQQPPPNQIPMSALYRQG